MRGPILAALLAAGASGLLLTDPVAAENKAQIVWDKVEQCTNKFYDDIVKCPGGSGFSAELCRDLTRQEYEGCKKAAHDSILEAPARAGGGPVVQGVRQPHTLRPLPKLQAAPR